jgi:hypothetical protein
MQVTVRKNFILDKNIALYLEELAKDENKSMTSLIQEMIEERYQIIRIKKRLVALEKIDNLAHGLLTNLSIQSIKEQKDV